MTDPEKELRKLMKKFPPLGLYILANRQPIKCKNVIWWSRWMATHKDKIVEQTNQGDIMVSTVFLGLDHRHGDGTPLLFETLVFGGPLADEMVRYTSWDQAQAGHNKMVALVFDQAILA